MDAARFQRLPFLVQLGHVAAEAARVRAWQERGDAPSARRAAGRGLELLALAAAGARTIAQRRECERLTAVFAQLSGDELGLEVTSSEVEAYLLPLAILGRS